MFTWATQQIFIELLIHTKLCICWHAMVIKALYLPPQFFPALIKSKSLYLHSHSLTSSQKFPSSSVLCIISSFLTIGLFLQTSNMHKPSWKLSLQRGHISLYWMSISLFPITRNIFTQIIYSLCLILTSMSLFNHSHLTQIPTPERNQSCKGHCQWPLCCQVQ